MSSTVAAQLPLHQGPADTGRLQAALGKFILGGNALARKEWSPRIIKDLFNHSDGTLLNKYEHLVYATITHADEEVELVMWDPANDRTEDGVTRDELEQTCTIEVSDVHLFADQLASADELIDLWKRVPGHGDLSFLEKALVSIGIKLVDFDLALRKHGLNGFREDMARIMLLIFTAGSAGASALDLYNSIGLKNKAYAYLTTVYYPQALVLLRQLCFNKSPTSWRAFTAFFENYLTKLPTQAATAAVVSHTDFGGSFAYSAICFATRATLSVVRVFTGPTVRAIERAAMKELSVVRASAQHAEWCDEVDAAAKRHQKETKLVAFIMDKHPPGRPLRRNLNPDQARGLEIVNTLQMLGVNPPTASDNHDKAEKFENIMLAVFISGVGVGTALRGGFARLNAAFTGFDMVTTAILDFGLPGVRENHAKEKVDQRFAYILYFQLPVNFAQYFFGIKILNDMRVFIPLNVASHLALWTYGDRLTRPITSVIMWTRIPKLMEWTAEGGWRMTKAGAKGVAKIGKLLVEKRRSGRLGDLEQVVSNTNDPAFQQIVAEVLSASGDDESLLTEEEVDRIVWTDLSAEEAADYGRYMVDEEDLLG
jgi:hypothetical protein